MKCCVVVDTNVIVSALLSKKDDAATVQVLRAMLGGGFTPLYHEDILDEYEEVLHRPRACLKNAFCEMCFTLCGEFIPNL